MATLHGTVTEAVTGTPIACTVVITDASGRLVLENDAFKAGFRCTGEFTKELPPGQTRIRVTRGFETQFVEKELYLEAGSRREVTFNLKRNVDL
jgi:hypothetical protein